MQQNTVYVIVRQRVGLPPTPCFSYRSRDNAYSAADRLNNGASEDTYYHVYPMWIED